MAKEKKKKKGLPQQKNKRKTVLPSVHLHEQQCNVKQCRAVKVVHAVKVQAH